MFSDFHGNAETVRRLRDMIARDHFPHGIVLAGGKGAGKYTLALMLAQALNCLTPTTTDGLPDFCGTCANCVRIAQSVDLDARFAEAVEAVSTHGELGAALREGRLQTYPAMPPLLLEELPDGRFKRSISVGLLPKAAGAKHEIVGFNLADRSIVRFETNAPNLAQAHNPICGIPYAGQPAVSNAAGKPR